MQKMYELQEGVFKSIEIIKEQIEKNDWNIIVLIAWWSASWKTSQVAKRILDHFDSTAIMLSMDNYYRGKEYYDKYKLNFDQPEALNLDLFFEHLSKLKNWETVNIPEYDFKNSSPILDKIEVVPKKIIIIEWLFALYDKIATLWDIKIFVDLWTHWRILRRILRDIKRTGQKPQDILDYFLDTVEPMNDKYIEPTKINADFIISNEYNPYLEANQTNILDLQKKYNISDASSEKIFEILLKIWAQYLGDVEYTDYYFSPDYIDSREVWNSEILFIRKIAFWKYILMYKWPLSKDKEYEERNIINFFVDADTVEEFREIYGDDIVIISRKRSSYFYNWILIFVDFFENWDKSMELKFEKYDENTKTKVDNIFKELCLGDICKILSL